MNRWIALVTVCVSTMILSFFLAPEVSSKWWYTTTAAWSFLVVMAASFIGVRRLSLIVCLIESFLIYVCLSAALYVDDFIANSFFDDHFELLFIISNAIEYAALIYWMPKNGIVDRLERNSTDSSYYGLLSRQRLRNY